jgi:hypothetical protein
LLLEEAARLKGAAKEAEEKRNEMRLARQWMERSGRIDGVGGLRVELPKGRGVVSGSSEEQRVAAAGLTRVEEPPVPQKPTLSERLAGENVMEMEDVDEPKMDPAASPVWRPRSRLLMEAIKRLKERMEGVSEVGGLCRVKEEA